MNDDTMSPLGMSSDPKASTLVMKGATADSSTEAEVVANLSSRDHARMRQGAFDAANLGMESVLPRLVDLFNCPSVGVQEACEFAVRKIRGQKAVDLIIPCLRSENVTIRNIAMDILREICTDNMSSVIILIQDEDSDIRIFSTDILGTSASPLALLPLCNALLKDPEPNVRYQAAISLGTLGNPDASESLKNALNDEEWVQYAVIEALAKLRDTNSVEILLETLGGATPLVASMIIDALGDIKSVKATPYLLSYIENSKGPMRVKALKALLQILGPNVMNLLGAQQFSQMYGYMVECLKSEHDESTLITLLQGLSYAGVSPDGTQAIFDLAVTLELPQGQDILQASLDCLVAIGYNENLEQALTSKEELVRKLALEACGTLEGKAGRFAIKRHVNSLPMEDKIRAIELLADSSSENDVPYFLNLLDPEQNAHIICSALRFLGFAQRHVDAAPQMLSYLTHEDESVREVALEACLALDDEQTLLSIVSYIDNENELLRKIAAHTMGRLNAEYFIDELSKASTDESKEVRRTALQSIGYGLEDWEIKLPILLGAVNDECREIRLSVVEMLGENVNELTIPEIINALKDTDDWVKIRAMNALSMAGVTEAVADIIEVVKDESVLVRLEAINSLGMLGGDTAFQTLLGLVSDEDPEVQNAAQVAMENMTRGEGAENE